MMRNNNARFKSIKSMMIDELITGHFYTIEELQRLLKKRGKLALQTTIDRTRRLLAEDCMMVSRQRKPKLREYRIGCNMYLE
jgi:hypothetical protein